jgi:hypothetical protein
MLDFFAYRMHWRKEGVHPNNKFDPVFYAKRLFQQYAVDSFSKVEEQNLNYLRRPENQKKLRAEHYDRLRKYVEERANDRNMKPGTPVVLPSTFSGSSRHMAQEYKDAMAIVRKKGKNGIDYFLTMTANPDWDEITASLPKDENGRPLHKAIDRPDIVARVFKMKLDEMLKDIFEKKIFGKIASKKDLWENREILSVSDTHTQCARSTQIGSVCRYNWHSSDPHQRHDSAQTVWYSGTVS